MISAVSFGDTTQASSWAEKIKQPQTYIVKEEPSAAASIRGGNNKPSAGKTFLKILLTGAAIAGILALIAKSGKCKVPEGATGIVNKAKSIIDKAGNKVLDTVKKYAPAAKEKAGETAEQAVNTVA